MVTTRSFDTFSALGNTLRRAIIFLIAMSTLILSSSAFADSVVASLDKNTITENDVVQLTLRADFTNTGNGPDLSALKKNFDILGQSQNSQFSFNLGTNTAMSYWVISLMPKSVGTFEIPSIKIGDHASQPLKLIVKSAPQVLDSNGNPPVMVKTSVTDMAPYLQQQVVLTEQLFSSISLDNADLSTPSNSNLSIERLTDDQMSYKTINGTQYQVLTRQYLVFPQKSGLITIDGQSVRAMTNSPSGSRLVKVQSEPITLQVQPIPASYTSDNWLPSSKVVVSSKLTKTTDSPRVGDTLIWTIDISAKGALPEQIPQITFDSTKAYKLYPQPIASSSNKTATGITGHQRIKIEVVPTEPGKLTLPDVNVTYWDTNTESTKTVTAHTQSIDIAPAPGATPPTSDSNTGKPISHTPKTAEKTPTPNKATTTKEDSGAPISLAKKPTSGATPSKDEDSKAGSGWSTHPYIMAAVVALLIILASIVGLLFSKRKKRPDDEEAHVPTLKEFAPLSSSDESSAFKSLILCCQQDNLPELRSHLLEWARHRWGDDEIKSVEDIKRLAASVKLTQLLMEAEIMMYSNQQGNPWQGEPLAEALEEFKTGQPKKSQASQLKTLYPNF